MFQYLVQNREPWLGQEESSGRSENAGGIDDIASGEENAVGRIVALRLRERYADADVVISDILQPPLPISLIR